MSPQTITTILSDLLDSVGTAIKRIEQAAQERPVIHPSLPEPWKYWKAPEGWEPTGEIASPLQSDSSQAFWTAQGGIMYPCEAFLGWDEKRPLLRRVPAPAPVHDPAEGLPEGFERTGEKRRVRKGDWYVANGASITWWRHDSPSHTEHEILHRVIPPRIREVLFSAKPYIVHAGHEEHNSNAARLLSKIDAILAEK